MFVDGIFDFMLGWMVVVWFDGIIELNWIVL